MKRSRLFLIGVAAILSSFFVLELFVLFSPVVTQEAGKVYYVRPGISKRVVLSELSEQNILKHPNLFSLYVFLDYKAQLKAGEYLFPKGATLFSIWRQITTGSGFFYRQFIIIPGWTFKQLRSELNKNPWLRHTTEKLDDQQIMANIGRPGLSPEGMFFPETYNFMRNDLDLVVLKRAYDLMQNKLTDEWSRRAAGLPYQDVYQALIAASMIEKEGYLDAERPMIAGVIINRLNKDMLLQIDATVIYGMGDRYDGKLVKSNLLEDTPYNTYVHKGLPPTPIAMPGLPSIQAATHPQQSNYFYYVAKGDGSHQFSESLEAHNQAVQTANDRKNPDIKPIVN